MYSSVLSVLLMGMLPLVRAPVMQQAALESLLIAPPTHLAANAQVSVERLRERITASGMLIVDLGSSQEVYAHGANQRRPIASLAKMMTALLIVERHSLDEWVKIPGDIQTVEGSSAKLPPGSEFTVGDLLSALLVHSANDAAEALARYHSGSVEAFVTDMNARAASLGLKNTQYANPIGFDDPAQWSTPRDQAWLAMFILRRKDIRDRMSVPDVSIRSKTGHGIALSNTHQLLREESTPVIAGKTGTTIGAGQCLLSIVKEGTREYVVVLLGSRERYRDMRIVIDVLKDLVV